MAIENLNISVDTEALPPGVAFDPETNELSGIPEDDVVFLPGSQLSYTVPVVATSDNYDSVSKNITVIVKRTKYEIISPEGTSLGKISLPDLHSMAANGDVLDHFGLGSEMLVPVRYLFGDTNGVITECPFRLATVQQFALQNGTSFTGVGLEAKYALPTSSLAFDGAEPDNIVSDDRKTHGNNRWLYSAVRQWMNKTGTNWWSSQYEYDGAPSHVSGWTSAHALLDCFPSTFIDNLQSVRTVTKTHSMDGGGNDITYDKFFLLSTKEYGFTDNTAVDDEGSVWGLFDGAEATVRGHQNISKTTSGAPVWVRTAPADYQGDSYFLIAKGTLTFTGSSSMVRTAPACVV